MIRAWTFANILKWEMHSLQRLLPAQSLSKFAVQRPQNQNNVCKNVSLVHTSCLVFKQKGNSKKDKKPVFNSIDDVLDELSDDEDDEKAAAPTERIFANLNSPVAKFMSEMGKQKHGIVTVFMIECLIFWLIPTTYH